MLFFENNNAKCEKSVKYGNGILRTICIETSQTNVLRPF